MTFFESTLAEQLSRLSPRELTPERHGEASVLISLFSQGGEPHLLLTRRSSNLASYQGQVSFPGGMKEPGDLNKFDTALRETNEELGIDRNRVNVLGSFHDYHSREGIVVHTIPGFLKDVSRLSLQPEEVDYLIEVPIAFFQRNPPRIEVWQEFGRDIEVYFYDYRGEIIWGLTAKIIKQFFEFVEKFLP